jgi:hypothetical protein
MPNQHRRVLFIVPGARIPDQSARQSPAPRWYWCSPPSQTYQVFDSLQNRRVRQACEFHERSKDCAIRIERRVSRVKKSAPTDRRLRSLRDLSPTAREI